MFSKLVIKSSVCLYLDDRLVGQVVMVSASGAEDPGFESRLRQDFSGWSHAGDLKIGTPVATLPGAWRYRINAGRCQYTVIGEVEGLICNFSVWQHVKLSEQIRP